MLLSLEHHTSVVNEDLTFKAKDLTHKAKAKDLTLKAKDNNTAPYKASRNCSPTNDTDLVKRSDHGILSQHGLAVYGFSAEG